MAIGTIIGGIGAAAAAKQAFDPETPKTTTTTQVDPQTSAMQQACSKHTHRGPG